MGLSKGKYALGLPLPDATVGGAEFCNFAEATQEEIKKLSRKSISKSCELDPLPAVVLKGCFTVLLPTIAKIVNLSLIIDRCYARCFEGCYTIAHAEKI